MTECLLGFWERKKHTQCLRFERDLAHSEQFVVMWNTAVKTPSKTLLRYMDWNQLISLNGVHPVQLCNTFGLLLVVRTSPPLPVCDSKTVRVILAVWHPLLIMVVAQSLHTAIHNSNTSWFCEFYFVFVKKKKKKKKNDGSPFVLKRQTHDLAITWESTH